MTASKMNCETGISKYQITKFGRLIKDILEQIDIDRLALDYILSHPSLESQIQKILKPISAEYRRAVSIMNLPVWKTIRMGTHKSISDLRDDLLHSGYFISKLHGDILVNVTLAEKYHLLDLVKVTEEELGFTERTRTEVVFERARKLGLRLCPPEVGLQLRYQYPNQRPDEKLLIAMRDICDSDGNQNVFGIYNDKYGFSLHGCVSEPGTCSYTGKFAWVFCRKPKTALKTWMTIQTEEYISQENLKKAFTKAQCNINSEELSYLSEFIDKTKTKKDIKLVRISAKKLGFHRKAYWRDIYQAADQVDLNPCPIETASKVCLKYNGKPISKRIVFASERIHNKPIFYLNYNNWIFYASSDDSGNKLRATDEESFNPETLFVFAKRNSNIYP